MTKKQYAAVGVIAIAAVIAVACGVWLLNRHGEALGNISYACSEPETSASNISFGAQEGDKVQFRFASDIQSGDLDVTVYDSEGNIVKELDRAKELVDYLTLKKDDTYTVEVDYQDFVGSYQVKVYKVD